MSPRAILNDVIEADRTDVNHSRRSERVGGFAVKAQELFSERTSGPVDRVNHARIAQEMPELTRHRSITLGFVLIRAHGRTSRDLLRIDRVCEPCQHRADRIRRNSRKSRLKCGR